jgi:hypothetical protein
MVDGEAAARLRQGVQPGAGDFAEQPLLRRRQRPVLAQLERRAEDPLAQRRRERPRQRYHEIPARSGLDPSPERLFVGRGQRAAGETLLAGRARHAGRPQL